MTGDGNNYISISGDETKKQKAMLHFFFLQMCEVLQISVKAVHVPYVSSRALNLHLRTINSSDAAPT
jgi:hypothetical protein